MPYYGILIPVSVIGTFPIRVYARNYAGIVIFIHIHGAVVALIIFVICEVCAGVTRHQIVTSVEKGCSSSSGFSISFRKSLILLAK